MRPSIVVLGSGTPGREYDPPLKNAALIPEAARAIGRELAQAECNLIVFSSNPDYVEADVVAGFLAAGDGQGRVVVRAPQRAKFAFDGPAEQITVEPDPVDDWETSYYRSVLESDGVVVIGGGRSTRIAGVIAVARRTPLAALATFGGSAAIVWQHLSRQRNDTTREDLHLMGRAWQDNSASKLVESLLDQGVRRRVAVDAEAREAVRRRNRRILSSIACAVALILATATIVLAYATTVLGVAIACLLAGPMMGAAGGALLRDARDDEPTTVWPATRGLGAGVLAVTLYVASQLLTAGNSLDVPAAQRLMWFVIPMGTVAGYTFDLVYAKLRRLDVVVAEPIATSPAAPDPSRITS